MDYRLTVSYRGADFAGWQRQSNALAIQQVLEEAIEAIVGRPVRTMGAGRTDRGVHAIGQTVSLRLEREQSERTLVRGVNAHLPDSVRVMAAKEVGEGFDARRHAVGKTYRYSFALPGALTPIARPTTVELAGDADLERMMAASERLVGRHDFVAFAKSGGAHATTVRTIHRIEWVRGDDRLWLEVTGNGFLRGMVRGIVGTLSDIGRGRWEVEHVDRLLAGAPRSAAGPTAPARGLTLVRVFYPEVWGGPAPDW